MENKLIEKYNQYIIKWATELNRQEGIELTVFLGDIREMTLRVI